MNKTIGLKRANTLSNVATISPCEEQLDGAIFYCLNALTKRHSPSGEFRAVFVKGMFLKPNTKAFIHVLHFLFNVYDPKEFRKRFLWPIYDKNAESAFRSTTVEYVNSLVERGKLELEKIKAHTVVLPGGAKFMRFLLVLIKFVMKEELRRAGGGTEGNIIGRADLTRLVEHHQQWDEIGARMREIVQKDLATIQARIVDIDDLLEELFSGVQGPIKQMSFEKLMQVWSSLNRKLFEENESRRQKFKDATDEYNKMIVSAKKKLEPKELTLGVDENELKETLYQLEVLFPDNACHFRDVFDENGKIDAVKLFEIVAFLLPEISQHFASFTVRSIESLKFELKEISKVAVKSDSINHEIASLRRTLPFTDAKFQELNKGEPLDELNHDLAIRNKIFNTPPISLNFHEAEDGPSRAGLKRTRLALLDDDQIHQMNLRMKLLSTSICPPVPKTPRSARKPKSAAPSPVFAVPKPARKERMNPLSMLNKITAQGKPKPKPAQPPPANSTMNISSLSTLGDISLRPEFSSTLLGTPEKQTPQPQSSSHNRRSINTNETLAPELLATPVSTGHHHHQPSPHRFKAVDIIEKTVGGANVAMSPDSSLFLLGQAAKRRSSLLQIDQLQTSPSGRLDPLVASAAAGMYRKSVDASGSMISVPAIRISVPNEEIDSGSSVPVAEFDGEAESTLHHEEDQSGEDLSSTLVDMGAFNKLSMAEDGDQPAAINDEDLFNVSDGILTDFD